MPKRFLSDILLVSFAGVLLLAACAPSSGIYHTVQPGQTLYRIAKTYEVEEERLARINGITDPTKLKVNQRLFIPDAKQPRKVTAMTTPSPSAPVVPDSAPALSTPAADAPSGTAQSLKRSAPTVNTPAPQVAKPVSGIFIWPVKGKVLNGFGTQGQKVYKGIEIGVPNGTAVVAAASGKVIYSGQGIPGYGNLVILEHSDSFFSVYGYNQKNLVKMNDHVGQGEKIALSGLPPNGQSARLHFEIRKGKTAVNPILYLP